MAIRFPLAAAEVGAEVFVGLYCLIWRVIGRRRTCRTIRPCSRIFIEADIFRRLMRAIVPFRQLHLIGFNDY